MISILEDRIKSSSAYPFHIGETKTKILHQDVLKLTQLPEKSIIVANIPYYITSPILTHFLIHLHQYVGAMVIMMQKEVAEKILFEQARASRDAWLNWPTRVGPLLAADLGLEADRVVGALTEYVHKHISQLGEPEIEVEFASEA